MSSTLLFTINEKEVDTNNTVTDERDYSISSSFTKYQKNDMSLSSGVTYTAVSFNSFTSATFLRINSTQSLNIKLNGGSEIFVVNKDFIFWGTITGLTINNNSGVTADILVELYA